VLFVSEVQRELHSLPCTRVVGIPITATANWGISCYGLNC